MIVNYKTVSFEGNLEEAGIFAFTLALFVDPPSDSMCSESKSKDFVITIKEQLLVDNLLICFEKKISFKIC